MHYCDHYPSPHTYNQIQQYLNLCYEETVIQSVNDLTVTFHTCDPSVGLTNFHHNHLSLDQCQAHHSKTIMSQDIIKPCKDTWEAKRHTKTLIHMGNDRCEKTQNRASRSKVKLKTDMLSPWGGGSLTTTLTMDYNCCTHACTPAAFCKACKAHQCALHTVHIVHCFSHTR